MTGPRRHVPEHRWRHGVLARFLGRLAEPRRGEVIGDLLEDLHRDRREAGRLRAEWRLLISASSIRRAYVRAATRGRAGWVPAALRVKALRRSPLFALAAAAALAVGVTIVAGVAGFIDALLLRPISRIDPDAVFRVTATSARGVERLQFAWPEVELVRGFVEPHAELAAVHLAPVLIRSAGASAQSLAEVVSGPYFDVLGTRPLAGRVLTREDDRPAAPPAVVVSEVFWSSRLGRSAGAVGTTLFLNNTPFVIAGIVAGRDAVTFAAASTDVWVPLRQADALLDPGWAADERRQFLTLVGRVATGDPRERLAGPIDRAGAALAARFPETRRDDRLLVRDGRLLVGSSRRAAGGVAAVLGVLALLVFGLVAANVAGLFAARALRLRRSVAVRRALGAPATAVVGEALIEGVLIGAGAGLLAVLGYAAVRAQLASVVILPTLALRLDLPAGPSVYAWIVGLASATGLALAAGPAWSGARADVGSALRAGRGFTSGRASARARRALVALQVTVALVLVVAATVLTRAAGHLQAADLGIDVDRLAIVDLDVVPPVPPAGVTGLARDALEAVRALPDVEHAAMSSGAPVDATTPLVDVTAGGGAVVVPRVNVIRVTHGYFDAVGVRVIAGRPFADFDSADVMGGTGGVAIVNEVLARRLGGEPIGQTITLPPDRALRIVGVASGAKYRSVSEGEQANVYVATAPGFHLSIVARSSGDPRRTLGAMQRALDEVGPGVQGFFPRTGRDHLAFDLLPTDVGSAAARIVGGLALALSALALYGLVAWLVEMRRAELGLRVAIGASGRDLRRLVIRETMRSVGPGIAVGLPAALGIGLALPRLLAGVPAPDAGDIGLALAAIATVALLASWVPARRAATADPVALLRD